MRIGMHGSLSSQISLVQQAPDETGEEQHQEYEEKDLRNFSGADGDPAKPQDRGDNGDEEKDKGVVQHDASHPQKAAMRRDAPETASRVPSRALALSTGDGSRFRQVAADAGPRAMQ
jgi:hypothetical protein